MITIKGILERLTYQNPDNHYTVAKLRIAKISDPVTVVGHLAGVFEGESLEVSGKWTAHPKYGDQFKAEIYKVVLPATVAGIRKYLGSGMIKGIGKSLADKIVDQFEERTLDIIENEPEKLKEIYGIGEVKKELIEQAWNKHHAVRRVMQFLQENDVGVYHAATILQIYGSETLSVLQQNPYAIAKDLPGIGFAIADMIAMKAGGEKDDENRLQACLVYTILLYEKEGHVYTLKKELLKSSSKTSGVDPDKFEQAIEALIDLDELRAEPDEDDIKIYLSRLYRAESGIASKMKAVLSMPVISHQINQDQILEKVLIKLAIKLSTEQLSVVNNVLHEKIVVITGGPGTGKTTLIRALCAVYKWQDLKVVLSAPTGRAARRLSEVTGKKAFTLHKLLGFDYENQTFEKNFANPLELDMLVVDEASMVDTQLMYRLVEAMPVSAGLILVGDTFQLPSVGPGNVLSDIIESGRIKVFSLTNIFRQAKESPIIMYAHSIRNGEMPDFQKAESGELSEFYFIENRESEKVVETILELCSKRVPKAFPHIDEIQVLTPMHRGEAGTINLNQQLQRVLNQSKGGIEAGGVIFKPNDKVMHLKNNYEKDVFNGDIGVVHEVIKSKNKILVDYDGRIVEYDILDLDELTLAYTISVHKSQGSEYAAVIVALTTAHFPLLQRNLLYTAMTRGKNLVIIVGSSKALKMALDNNKTALRLS
ncbi:MAG: ATP-dependent RecD-like DNA helicase, partial [Desulfobacterales bacterium]|nr:ATP-dependent RecD-like DNA helicase [Desulfobacterales bacterium]